jgi:copper homeostasis protein
MPRTNPSPARRVLLEVCVETLADAEAAAAGGADRLELNSALALDGLTPSLGLLAEVRRAVGRPFPLVAMARPRAGGFCYDDADFRVLLRDVDLLLQHGADGIAFGILNPDGGVDVKRCRQVVRRIESASRSQGVVFHRAFDVVRNPKKAISELMDMGVRRVMTSGGQATALRGASRVAELNRHAGGRIEFLPAGGVRPTNAARILSLTGCDQLHTSLRVDGVMSRQLLSRLVATLRR